MDASGPRAAAQPVAKLGTYVLERAYERRLRRQVHKKAIPVHIGIILDCAWSAASYGSHTEAARGMAVKRLLSVIDWCAKSGVELVTIWLSPRGPTDDEDSLPAHALDYIVSRLEERSCTRIIPLGTANATSRIVQDNTVRPKIGVRRKQWITVHITLNHDGDPEALEGLREWVILQHSSGSQNSKPTSQGAAEELGSYISMDSPPPDLLIRTSADQDISRFLPWYGTQIDPFLCDVLWPNFRMIDFWRVLRSYSMRHEEASRGQG